MLAETCGERVIDRKVDGYSEGVEEAGYQFWKVFRPSSDSHCLVPKVRRCIVPPVDR